MSSGTSGKVANNQTKLLGSFTLQAESTIPVFSAVYRVLCLKDWNERKYIPLSCPFPSPPAEVVADFPATAAEWHRLWNCLTQTESLSINVHVCACMRASLSLSVRLFVYASVSVCVIKTINNGLVQFTRAKQICNWNEKVCSTFKFEVLHSSRLVDKNATIKSKQNKENVLTSIKRWRKNEGRQPFQQ